MSSNEKLQQQLRTKRSSKTATILNTVSSNEKTSLTKNCNNNSAQYPPTKNLKPKTHFDVWNDYNKNNEPYQTMSLPSHRRPRTTARVEGPEGRDSGRQGPPVLLEGLRRALRGVALLQESTHRGRAQWTGQRAPASSQPATPHAGIRPPG